MSASVRTKAAVLLAGKGGASSEQQLKALSQAASRIADTLGEGAAVRSAVTISPDEMHQLSTQLTSETATPRGDLATTFQGMLTATAPGGAVDTLVAAFHGLGSALAPVFDLGTSAALVGTEETFIPGDGPLVGMHALRRLPGQSFEDFHNFWRLGHTKQSMLIPDFRYRQFHAALFANKMLADSTGVGISDFDGSVEHYCDSVDFYSNLAAWSGWVELNVDELNFIDHSRSSLTIFRFI